MNFYDAYKFVQEHLRVILNLNGYPESFKLKSLVLVVEAMQIA